MCKIALSKSTEKVYKEVTIVTVVRKITQPLHKKITQPLKKKNFLSTFWKCNLTHLTTDVMFSRQRLRFLWCFNSKHFFFNIIGASDSAVTVCGVLQHQGLKMAALSSLGQFMIILSTKGCSSLSDSAHSSKCCWVVCRRRHWKLQC